MDPVSITIDHRTIRVAPGTTILQAAEWLGIRIPTLCHVKGLEPSSSCFVCAVQIEGRRTLSPACAMPVSEGMSVITDSRDVRSARRMALELLLSDHAGECVAPCAARCPAGLDIPGFVYQIAAGDNQQSMRVITERLALPGSLGRVCPRLCEQQCHRCDQDQGLAIGALHRYAADLASDYVPRRAPSTNKTVAIIGAGPAGLAAAYFLQQKGHACTLYDAAAEPGGMLRYGIPAYRLPKDALDIEIRAIRELGAAFRMNQRWGVDFTLASLRASHDAVFVAIGAQLSQRLACEGEDLAISGLDFLAGAAKGAPPNIGRDVVILGGGNTAMDCARTAVRLGARHVKVIYRRTRQEMPCLMEEVEGAETEGVELQYLAAPVRIAKGPNHTLILTCQRMQLGEPDASGRRRPVPVEGSEFLLECSAVIAAVGQSVQRDLAAAEGLQTTKWGIAADERTLSTNLPGVFAGGDAVLGADLAVRAVAAGRMAAFSMDQYLRGEPLTGEPHMANVALRPIDESERAAMFRAIEQAARVPMPEIPLERRVMTFEEVDLGLTDDGAHREARRCMSCGCRKAGGCRIRNLATEHGVDITRFAGDRRRFSQDDSHAEVIYEPGKCIMCNACVRVAARAGEPLGLHIAGRGFDVAVAVPFGESFAEGLKKSAVECAEVCPTGAIALRTSRACDFDHCGRP